MDYRSRWQLRRKREARRRLLRLVAACVLVVGLVLLVGRRERGALVWREDLGARGPVYFVAHEGGLYCALAGGRADAMRIADGERLWPAPITRALAFGVPPAAADDDLVYVNDAGAVLCVARHTGHIIWEVETDAPTRCPPLIREDILHVGTDGGAVLALGLADGIERRRIRAPAAVNSGFVVVRGVLVFGTADGRVLGVRATDGRPTPWRARTVQMPVFARPIAVGPYAAVPTDGGRVFLLNPHTGAVEAWAELPAAGLVRAAPVADDAALYVATTDGWIAAYDITGPRLSGRLETLWTRRIGRTVSAGPVLHDGRLYCADGARSVLALAADSGKVRFRRRCPAKPQGSLAVAEGLVLVGTADGQVIAFRDLQQ